MKKEKFDFELIKKYDLSDMLELLKNFPSQCREAYSLPTPLPANRNFSKIVFCGMGGSAIGGDILKIFVDKNSKIPFYVHRDYGLPNFVDRETLLIAASYSGNTEETLSAYEEGKNRGCTILCITSNGELENLALKDNIPFIKIPGGYPPRCAFGYLFFPVYKALTEMGILRPLPSSIFEKIEEWVNSFIPEKEENLAIEISQKFHKKVPVIYSDNTCYPAILRWKTQIAENSKMFAFINVFPEMNHNEIMSWHFPEWFIKNIVVVFITTGLEYARNKERMEITSRIISKLQPEILKIEGKGENLFEKLIYIIILGDWISYYLGLLNNVDPTEIKEIDFLKKELKRGKK
ncbi:bifunctional phosphoglucose/phosphomannose isomerase [bacterium]|nr:bifunctional phosphoglucose/phosphomannose isomerase [bacterium]